VGAHQSSLHNLANFAAHSDVGPGVFDLSRHGTNWSLADRILSLGFPEEDATRIKQLNGKANQAILTEEEEAELEAYIIVNDLLAYWQSKAQ
jgi:hypothetical protein